MKEDSNLWGSCQGRVFLAEGDNSWLKWNHVRVKPCLWSVANEKLLSMSLILPSLTITDLHWIWNLESQCFHCYLHKRWLFSQIKSLHNTLIFHIDRSHDKEIYFCGAVFFSLCVIAVFPIIVQRVVKRHIEFYSRSNRLIYCCLSHSNLYIDITFPLMTGNEYSALILWSSLIQSYRPGFASWKM